MADEPQKCFAVGCSEPCQGDYAFCRAHWARVPADLQQRISRAKYAGQRKGHFGLLQTARGHLQGLPEVETEMIPITGRTYAVRDRLRAIGGYWDEKEKCWYVPKNQRMVAEALVLNADRYEVAAFEDS